MWANLWGRIGSHMVLVIGKKPFMLALNEWTAILSSSRERVHIQESIKLLRILLLLPVPASASILHFSRFCTVYKAISNTMSYARLSPSMKVTKGIKLSFKASIPPIWRSCIRTPLIVKGVDFWYWKIRFSILVPYSLPPLRRSFISSSHSTYSPLPFFPLSWYWYENWRE